MPERVIAARRDPGRKPYVIGLLDQADPASFSRPPDVWIRLGQAGKGVRLLKSAGDQIGGGLIAALREAIGGKLEIAGIGGEAMSAEGLERLFPIEELAVMGLVEVLPRAFSIMRRMSETAETIGPLSPDAMVTIDAPSFANGVWRHLGELDDTPLIHYVAPTVWAWRARGARKLAGRIDHLLALLPFGPPCFEAEGLGCTFVGHPGLETEIASGACAAFRARHGMEAGPAIGLLPGSRSDEISRLMPVFADAIRRIAASVPAEREERHAAMAACDTAIAASGTVTLELALARVPMVVAYRFHPLTASVMRRMIRVRYATIVNLILDRPAIPEFLQERCTGSRLAEAALELLRDEGARRMQREAAASAIAALRPAGRSPSTRAAEAILDVVRRRSKARTEQGAFA